MLIGDQACHRSDERAKSAEVGTDDKCLVIRCKSRQQKGGWHVADDLAGTDCNGVKVALWTVDTEDAVRSLLPLGPDCLVTNRPDRVREWVEENQ